MRRVCPIRGGLLIAAATACSPATTFVCSDDAACVQDGNAGRCEPVGFCSFPDEGCESGRRYGPDAGDGLGSTCVPTMTGTTSTTGGSTSTGPGTTTGPEDSCPDWWDCAWTARRRLDVTSSFPVDLPGFPMLVALDPSRIDYDAARTGGADLRFVASDDLTVIPHEIVTWQAGGTSEVWVRFPNIVAGETSSVFMYWGNPEVADAQDPRALWDTYEAVWHLELPTESTARHDLLVTDAVPSPGLIGGALAFDGLTAEAEDETGAPLADLFVGGGSLSVWINATSLGGGGFARIVDNADTTNATDGWTLRLVGTDGPLTNGISFAADHEMGIGNWGGNSEALVLMQWQHVGVTFNGTDPPGFVIDGIVQRTQELDAPSGVIDVASLQPITIGNVAGGTTARNFDGSIDEVRLSRIPRPVQWFEAEVQAANDSLIQYGDEEPAPAGP